MGRKTVQSKNTYNKIARQYASSMEGNYTSAHRAELLRKAAVADGDSVLDVACGDGTLLSELSKKADIFAFGVDISENMIAVAKERLPNGKFSVGTCAPLGFKDESIDAIIVSCAFHHFEEPQAFAYECIRVLKKGGKIYMAEPNYSPLVRFVANALVFPFLKTGDVKVYSERELKNLFEATGFTGICTHAADTVLFFSAVK